MNDPSKDGNGNNGGNGRLLRMFSWKIPFFEGKMENYHLGNVLQMILTGALFLLAFVVWDTRQRFEASAHELDVKVEQTRVILSMAQKTEHDKIMAFAEKIVEAQLETNYLLTLSTEEKAALKLEMPDTLRRRIRGR